MTNSSWLEIYPQLAIFPLHLIVDGRCGCGYAACSQVGKHPDGPWGDLEPGEKRKSPHHPRAGYGVATGARSGIIVLDVDSDEALEGLKGDREIPSTFTVATGRCVQFWFQWPGFPVRNSAGDLGEALDIRGDGGYVVAPGSPHRNGRTYEIIDDLPPAPAPAWLLEWLKARPAPTEAHQYDGDVTEPKELAYRRRLFEAFLKTAAPCVEGRGGDAQLYKVVQRGAYDLCLPSDDVLELIRKHYDPRCVPPWGDQLEERVLHKSNYAKLSSTRSRMEPLPRELFDLGAATETLTAAVQTLTTAAVELGAKVEAIKGMVWGGWDVPPPPVNWLVDTLIPVSTVGMFVAMGSSLKTWTALDLGLAVAKGTPWLGKYATKKRKTLIADFESGMHELHRRVHLLEGGDIPTLGAWSYPEGLRIDDPEFWKVLAKIDDLGLIIIDSLAAGAPGVDENAANVAMPLKFAARLSELPNGPATLFIHHSRKDDGGDDRKMVRGSTAIYADCDWAYKFENIEETATYRRMHMACIKPCMGPKPPPVQLELSDADGLIWFEDSGAPKLSSKEATPEAIQSTILLALAAAGPAGIATKEKLAAAVGIRKDRVSPEIDELKVRKEIAQLAGRGYVLDSQAARLGRIVVAVETDESLRTESQIAKAAGVGSEDVREALRKNSIVRSAEGRYLACI